LKTVNLTQHAATADQIAAGVFDLPPAARVKLQSFLTFENLPSEHEIRTRANEIAKLAAGAEGGAQAMIGGALWLMAPLAAALRDQRIKVVFAFSVRSNEEEAQADGSVRKVVVFRHAGFVPALP